MLCKTCGTEIADKALICYRCGTPTSSPARPLPASKRSPVGQLITVLALVVLVVAALFLGFVGNVQVPPALSYGVAAVAAVILVWRVLQRRPR